MAEKILLECRLCRAKLEVSLGDIINGVKIKCRWCGHEVGEETDE